MAQDFSSFRHLRKFPGAQQLLHTIRQILDTIHLRRRATFEEKIAVGRFLAGNGIQDEHWSQRRLRLAFRFHG